MFKALSETIDAYGRALGMITKHGLIKYMIVPGLISLGVMFGLVGGLWTWFTNSSVEQWLIDLWPFEWGVGAIEAIASILALLLLMVSIFFLAKYIVMVIVSPFMGSLSEKVEAIVTGKKEPSTSNFISDLIRGLRIALRNVFWELFLTVILLFANLIPVIGSIAALVLTFMVQSYYAGFGSMDYTLERKHYGIRDSVNFVRTHRWTAMGNGSIFLLIFLIPVAGWFLAPAFATVAGTVVVLKRLKA
ncbi:MAG: EI24 domain-containing protein [Bacteroidota bacterium]